MEFYRAFLLSIFLMIGFPILTYGMDFSEKETIQRGDVNELQARIRMHKGRLAISSDAYMLQKDRLLEVEYVFHTPTKRPEFLYEVEDTGAHLILEQEANATIGQFPNEDQTNINEWNLHITPQVGLDLQIILGMGNADLDFSDLHLKKLQLDLGKAEATVDLTGVKSSAVIVIDALEGVLNLMLPQEQPIIMTTQRGENLSSLKGFQRQDNLYYNASYQKGQPHVYIDIKADSKSIKVAQK